MWVRQGTPHGEVFRKVSKIPGRKFGLLMLPEALYHLEDDPKLISSSFSDVGGACADAAVWAAGAKAITSYGDGQLCHLSGDRKILQNFMVM